MPDPAPPAADALVDRITRFIDAPARDAFGPLALDAFAFQYERIPPFRRLCEARGARPGAVADWRQVPAVPAAAFQTLELRAAPAHEIFRSSGTTGNRRSVHYHPYPELYRRVIDASFPDFCLTGDERPPMLSLVPSRRQLPDSSLGFMVDHILRCYGSAASRVAFSKGGVDAEAATAWCAERRRDGRPGLILATAFALVGWLDAIPEGTPLELPPGTVVFETGGFKGRMREITRSELLERLASRLGIVPDRVVREYGMTELTSQCYTRVLDGGDPDVFVGPAWLKVRLLDPETLEEAKPGEPGIIAVFDLANVGSAVHVLTQDVGVAEGDGFRLLGRASGAELRGCSLTVEELENEEA
ncbi:MAG: long-chain fatty acid--CoA ligase [bacterium]|nr:long-chain fatty acid--CoA ligase [bacterium]